MEDFNFEKAASDTLEYLVSCIEDTDVNAVLDVEYSNDILNIQLLDGREYVINRHLAMKEIWLSSPVRGAFHFSLAPDKSSDIKKLLWQDKKGNNMFEILAEDLKESTGIQFLFDYQF